MLNASTLISVQAIIIMSVHTHVHSLMLNSEAKIFNTLFYSLIFLSC